MLRGSQNTNLIKEFRERKAAMAHYRTFRQTKTQPPHWVCNRNCSYSSKRHSGECVLCQNLRSRQQRSQEANGHAQRLTFHWVFKTWTSGLIQSHTGPLEQRQQEVDHLNKTHWRHQQVAATKPSQLFINQSNTHISPPKE